MRELPSSTTRPTTPTTKVLESIGDHAFISLAISSKRREIISAVAREHFAHAALLECRVDGVPGLSRLGVFAWPEPPGRATRIGVDVVRLDEYVLAHPITHGFYLEPHEAPQASLSLPLPLPISQLMTDDAADDSAATGATHQPRVIVFGEVEWRLAKPAREVVRLDKDGNPCYREASPTACYRLLCSRCGRARYAQRNSIHQIKYCHVCTRQQRLRRRALTQYYLRHRPHSPRRVTAQDLDSNNTQAELARRLGVDPSTISKARKRWRAP